MNITRLHILPVILLLMVAVACSRRSDVSDTLAHAEAIMEEHPDSALAILEAIPDSTLTSRADGALHALLLSQALDKNYIDITSDSLINIAVDYYQDHGDQERLMKALFYNAKIYYNCNDFRNAFFSSMESRNVASTLNNHLWLAKNEELQADIYHKTYFQEEEINHRKNAISEYDKASKHLNKLYSLVDLALFYLDMDCIDSCKYTLNYLSELNTTKDSIIETLINKTFIITSLREGDYSKALSLRDSLLKYHSFVPSSSEDYRIFAEIELGVGNFKNLDNYVDSIRLLSNNAQDSLSLYLVKRRIYKAENRTLEAASMIDSVLLLQNEIVNEALKQSVIIAQRDYYNLTTQKHHKNFLFLKTISISITVISILIIFLILIIYRFQIKLKKTEMENKVNDILQLSEELSNLKIKSERWENIINKIYFNKFDKLLVTVTDFINTPSSTPFLKMSLVNIEKEIVQLADEEFVMGIEKDIDEIKNGMIGNLRKLEKFNNEDIRLFMFMCLNFSPRSISFITKNNLKTIYTRKRRLKEKIISSEINNKSDYLRILS